MPIVQFQDEINQSDSRQKSPHYTRFPGRLQNNRRSFRVEGSEPWKETIDIQIAHDSNYIMGKVEILFLAPP